MVDQVVERVFETAGDELPFKIDREEARAGVNGLVAGHGAPPVCDNRWSVDIPFGSRQDAVLIKLFLQPRYA